MVITNLEDNTIGMGITDSEGQFGGFVPNDALLLLEIWDACDEVMYSTNIGPYSENTDLGTITLYPTDVDYGISRNKWLLREL